MTTANFPPELGGDGITIDDTDSPTTGLGNGGHRIRFMLAMQQFLKVAQWCADTALTVLGYRDAAATSASDAAESATAAAESAEAAAEAAAAAGGSEGAINSRYYGALASDPIERPNGDPMEAGDRYFNTTTSREMLYTGAVWMNPNVGAADLVNPDDEDKGDALLAVRQPFAGAVARSQHEKNYDFISLTDAGGIGDGVTNNDAALSSVYAETDVVYFPAGKYVTTITAPRRYFGPGIPVRADGTFATNFITLDSIEVDTLDALAAFPADLPAGIEVTTRKERQALVALAPASTNPVFDFSDVGGAKFTYVDGRTTRFSLPTKAIAISKATADTMSADLSAMTGYALSAGTTGGGSGTIYWVTNTADDIYTPGSFRWAVEQVRLAGSGRVLFHPRGVFDVYLTTQNLIPSNITIDAPGRNARLWAPSDVTRLKVTSATNVIIRRLQFSSAPGATATLRDGIWITPDTVDKVWIDSCSFRNAGDGCIDMSTIPELTADCRVTVSRSLFRQHDKGMLIGSLACYNPTPPAWCPTASPSNVRCYVTLQANYFDSVGQRQPKVISQAFVDSINNVHRISQQLKDDGTLGGAYGILTATGGSARSRGDLFLSAKGTGWSAVDAVRTAQVPLGGGTGATDGPGYVDYTTDTIALDGMTLAKFNEGSVPTPPYTIVPMAIPATVYARRQFALSIRANAGAQFSTGADGEFRWNAASTEAPNGFDVLSETSGAGRWERTDRMQSEPFMAQLVPASRTIQTPRGTTIVIASDAIAAPDTGTYFAVDTEGAASSDDLTTITGAADGRWLVLRSASGSRTVTIKNSGNIAVPGDYVLGNNNTAITLMYDGTTSRWLMVEQTAAYGAAYNSTKLLRLGAYYLWVDASNRLRIKSGAPTSDTDGTIVGTQS